MMVESEDVVGKSGNESYLYSCRRSSDVGHRGLE